MNTNAQPYLRAGLGLALATALISGVSIYLNKFALAAVGDVLLFTTLKNTLVGLSLAAYLLVAGRRLAPFSQSRRQWLGLAALAIVGGSLPFLLFFRGLALASAPSAALIHKSLFLWVALLAAPLLGERPARWTLAGLGLLVLGHLLHGWPQAWGWGGGESLILLATLLWSVETILARRLLPGLPVAVAAAARMAGGALIMWAYLFAAGGTAGLAALPVVAWGWIVLTSALLLGYVTTWYAALRRAPAVVVTSVLTAGAAVTAGLTLVVEGRAAGPVAALGLLAGLAGMGLIAGLQARRRDDARIAGA
jgi:drug/metabolite transporter (DMT)-like permease